MEFDCVPVNSRNKFGKYYKISEIDLPDLEFYREYIAIMEKKHPGWKYHVSKHLKPDLKHVLYFTEDGRSRRFMEMYGKKKSK